MKLLASFWQRFRSLWHGRAVREEIDEELRFHIEARTAENMAAGMTQEEAERDARKRFGNKQSVREDCRDVRGASFGQTLLQDVKFGLRILWKDLGFTTVAALTLGLGIGANSTMFSMLKPLLFFTLPYPEPEDLVRVHRTSPQSQTWSHSRADFLDYRKQNHVFSTLVAYMWEGFNYNALGQTSKRLTAVCVSADFFPMIGIQPLLGRGFSKEEHESGAHLVTVLSHSFWMSQFLGDTNVIGRKVRFDDETFTVIGVLPEKFDFPILWGQPDVWRPFVITAEEKEDRENRFLSVIGRLKRDVSLSEARADMNALSARIAKDFPQYDGGSGVRVVPLAQSFQVSAQKQGLWFLLCLTGFVLLIACVNLANLQLARTTRRLRELAVRAAFGASRKRLVRQLLTESLLISILGGVLGILFASWCYSLVANSLEMAYKTVVDFQVILFTLASCIVTTLVFGAAPAWLAVRTDLNEKLKETVRGATSTCSQQRLLKLLIISEVALVLVLLAGAGCTLQLLQRFSKLDPGWQTGGLLTVPISPSKAKYSNCEQRLAFLQQIEDRVAALPGVKAVSFTTDIPIMQYWNTQPLRINGQPAPARRDMPLASCPTVGAGFFQTLRISLREGRFFSPNDKLDKPPVVIINECLARHFWPGQSPLGKRISIGDPTNLQWREIVGVVNDAGFPADIDKPETKYQVYRPWAQDDIALGGRLVLRITDKPESITSALRQTLVELDPELPLYSVRTVRQMIDSMMRGNYQVARLLGAFGILGLVLATVGIYGVTSYSMARRTAEIGIRMALGAQQPDILWMLLRQGLKLGLAGTLVGLGGAFAVMRILVAIIPEGSPALDPVTLLSVPVSGWLMALAAGGVLMGVTLLACYLPARHAAVMNPLTALRSE